MLKEGDTVEGRYRIIRALDQGGMGTVFLAEHVLIKRRVAIKVMRAELSLDPDVIERFMNEARAAGTLGHPNIVESTDMGFTREGVPYIVFEYLEGSLLTDEIYRVGGMPVRRAVRIARQIASALSAAHAAGVIHRDLKTDNVFLTDKEEASDHVKVLDFGISRFLEADDDRSGVRSMVIGTPQFMAPEQITAPETVDHRADIYALGVIIYEMLTARRPFASDDTDTLLGQIISAPPPPLGLRDAPPGLQEMLFTKLLAKNREDRYPTMKEVEAALEAFAGVLRSGGDSMPIPVSASLQVPPGLVAAKVIELPAPKPRARGTGWLIAAIAAGVAGGALMYLDGQATGAASTEDDARASALHTDLSALGAAIDGAARATQLRADGIAQTPMLRAAIETDAATVKDMVGSDFLFTPTPGEVFELFQLREQQTISMLRIPAAPPELDHVRPGETKFASTGSGLTVTVATPVATQKGAIGGAVVLRAPIDLASVKEAISSHVRAATLLGLGAPLVLAGGPTGAVGAPGARELTVSAKTATATKLTVAVVTYGGGTEGAKGRTFAIARNASWGVGGFLLVMYLLALLRGRPRG